MDVFEVSSDKIDNDASSVVKGQIIFALAFTFNFSNEGNTTKFGLI